MVLGWWRRRQAYAAAVEDQAAELIAQHGDHAYRLARDAGRLTSADDLQVHFWAKVAQEIARRQGHEIGADTATRYLER
ncbi:hypothetical protein [Blastochloris tepida]|uniref:Uncharacterized protein n=1 Tax=Blastochloris tepida TaxID=2233851 RepID=A0A348FXV8_9HYPH|nr:hypothetical protein [Blastochloris tepida]BBF92141.1 hypothetical protein BLTE_08260 [Blastochloris tepida]